MKRAGMVLTILGMAILWLTLRPAAAAQAAQTGGPSPAATTPTTPATAAQPKRPPQAKTQPEFDAYQAAMANAKDPATLEKSADDFATKFADSELRILLYRTAMHGYQSANNADKMLDMGRKVLAIDPDDPEALIAVAEVLVERTKDTDLDKMQRWDEATKLGQHALQTIDTDLAIPANTPQEKVDDYKGYLRSSVYSILGAVEFNKEKFSDAESYFRKSVDAYPSQPDPVVVLRLALALDKQGRYADALKEADKAVDLSQGNQALLDPAKRERDRLVQLTGGIPVNDSPAPATPAAPAQNAATPKK
jgi:tetratricopeptide (TPR) repeat protein